VSEILGGSVFLRNRASREELARPAARARTSVGGLCEAARRRLGYLMCRSSRMGAIVAMALAPSSFGGWILAFQSRGMLPSQEQWARQSPAGSARKDNNLDIFPYACTAPRA